MQDSPLRTDFVADFRLRGTSHLSTNGAYFRSDTGGVTHDTGDTGANHLKISVTQAYDTGAIHLTKAEIDSKILFLNASPTIGTRAYDEFRNKKSPCPDVSA